MCSFDALYRKQKTSRASKGKSIRERANLDLVNENRKIEWPHEKGQESILSQNSFDIKDVPGATITVMNKLGDHEVHNLRNKRKPRAK